MNETTTVTLNYKPRPYFLPFHNRTQRFACIVAHRRAGKTVACIHELLKRAVTNPIQPSKYAYVAPTYAQAKSTAWDYLIEAVAPLMPYGVKINQSDLSVKLPNGAEIRLFGADNYHTLRGLRLDGIVLDEYADIDPRAWTQVIRPAISDRRGFAVFIGTPRGHDHFFERYRDAVSTPSEWYAAALRASELVPEYGDKIALSKGLDYAVSQGYLTSDELEKAKQDQSEEWYRQEYECDFEAANPGAYYGKQMAEALEKGRITKVPYDPSYRVYTGWDIGGNRDATAIWFCQLVGRSVCLIDYYEQKGASSAPHARSLLDKDYVYAGHFLPHDSVAKHPGQELDYRESLEHHGLKNITVLPRSDLELGINSVRLLIPRCSFDAERTAGGIESLRMYQTEWDEKNRIFKSTPKHDWASHGADAFRYLAMGLDKHLPPSGFNRVIVYPKGY